ncbi:TonB-dependent receptor plug domain-containing protein [Fluviicola taffensis]|uniref:TonB-dependent receptor plug n=1 Tax=Fluviicola taffensis (strain DSM 16823 / NCIMB 13979 / RW262) TaxID=755732 RepID=F2IG18_FLUTR|nr:TonB-dependent receptor plug domain-containing protein [Fluviicola taffensis]AEA44653.1 TonB-dependent receptor plug [Fluviicola taffensis DSM 16823]
MRNQFLVVFLLVFMPLTVLWSQVQVTGNVQDKGKLALPNIQVLFLLGKDTLKTVTDKNGRFQIQLLPTKYGVIAQYDNENEYRKNVLIPNVDSFSLDPIVFNFGLIEIDINKSRAEVNGLDKIPQIDLQKQVLGGVERMLVLTQAGVNSNNELTSNYNVRGGNYDENEVYVDGFLINRPFLTRSGQQEGLSFINTALVEDIYFSSGGFQSMYGDKLSSVLDILYKKPDSLRISVMASLLGVEAHIEDQLGKHNRFQYLFGARYRANGYLLNSLPTKGNYNPVFWDAQALTTYTINEHWSWTMLGHVSSNTYQFAPQTSKTDFGTANEAYSFNIYFEGQEKTKFLTSTVGTSLNYTSKKYQGKTFFTYFRSDERENFDILGEYYINELETDPSKEEFGDSIAVLGVGGFLNHARNKLNADIFSFYHDGTVTFKTKRETSKHWLKVGAKLQIDHFTDVLSEWKLVDSTGYSQVDNPTDEVDLYETIKSKLQLDNQRYSAYVQDRWEWRKVRNTIPVSKTIKYKDSLGNIKERIVRDTIDSGKSSLVLDYGIRGTYTSFNDEGFITPRLSLTFTPVKYVYQKGQFVRRGVRYRLATGLYYQPPFYREFRTFTGGINQNVKSQKSAHFVLGMDYSFFMMKREAPFKFTAEAYYKYLWDVNPYEVDNVRTRYFANNDAVAYAAGLDLNLNGEFVPGLMSFFKLGFLTTKEDIKGDYYYNYYNAAGEKIIAGYSDDQVVVDSARVNPGYIRRPTDQHVTVGVMFQDHMPGLQQLTCQVGITYGSRLPYGPPDHSRYKDTLTMKAYFRVDMGMSYDILYRKPGKTRKFLRKMESAIISFEVFNLLGVNNVLSKQWIQDVSGKYYSIPNYLTQRRFNVKLIVRI